MNNESSSGAAGSAVEQDEITIKIKLLDGQEHQLQIPRNIGVAQLRERVAALTEVDAANQRLIYRGRVLKDEHTIADYNVDAGHVIHMVVRVPGSQTQPEETATPGTQPGQQHSHGVQHSVMMGAINIPDYTGVPDINQIVAGVLNSMGLGYQMATQPATGAAQAGPAPTGTAAQTGEQGPQVQVSEVEVQFETAVPMAGAPPPGTTSSDHPRVTVHRQPMPNAVVTMNRFVDTIESMLTTLETGNAPNADSFSNPAAEPAAAGTQPEVRIPAVVVQSGAAPMNLGAVNVVVGIPATNGPVMTTASTTTPTAAAPSLAAETTTAANSDQQGAPSGSAPASTPAAPAPTPPRATYGELGNLMGRVEQLLVGRAAAALGRAGAHLRSDAQLEAAQQTSAQTELQRVRRIVQYLGALLLELGRATAAVNLMAPPEQRLLPDRPTAFIAPAGNHVTIPMPITFGDAAFGFAPPANGMAHPHPHPHNHIAVHIQTTTSDAGAAPHSVQVPSNPAVPTGAEAHRPAGATAGGARPAFMFRVDSTGAVTTSATGARPATGTAPAAPTQTTGTGPSPAPQPGGDAQRAQAVFGAVAPLISMALGRGRHMDAATGTGTQTTVRTSSSTASQTVTSTAPATTNTPQGQATTAGAATAQPPAAQPAGLGFGALPMRRRRPAPSSTAAEVPRSQPDSQPTPSSVPLQATAGSAQARSQTNVALGQVLESLQALQGSSAAGQRQPTPPTTQPQAAHQTAAPQQRPAASGQLDLRQMLGALTNSAQGGGLGNVVGQLAQALGGAGQTGGSTTTSSAAAGGNIGQLVSQMVSSGALDGVMQQLTAPQQAGSTSGQPAAPDLSSLMNSMMPMVAQLFGNANSSQAQTVQQQPAGVHPPNEPITAEDADGVLSEEERREWNAVVVRDLQAQAAMGTPRPLSDAYLSGSPAKRQRVSGSPAENGDPGASAGEDAGTSMEELD